MNLLVSQSVSVLSTPLHMLQRDYQEFTAPYAGMQV